MLLAWTHLLRQFSYTLMWAVGPSNKTVHVGDQPETLHVDICMWVVNSCDKTFCVVPAHTTPITKAWLHTKPPADTPLGKVMCVNVIDCNSTSTFKI